MENNQQSANIVLIGMMGSGKTSLGFAISHSASMPFVDTDTLIKQKLNMAIPHIFEQYGESYFRSQETEIAHIAAAYSNTVIATGGGMVTRPENMAALGENGFVVYLRCTANQLYERTAGDENRPLLGELEGLERLLAERATLYEKYSNFIIDANDIPTLVEMILDEYRNYQRA